MRLMLHDARRQTRTINQREGYPDYQCIHDCFFAVPIPMRNCHCHYSEERQTHCITILKRIALEAGNDQAADADDGKHANHSELHKWDDYRMCTALPISH